MKRHFRSFFIDRTSNPTIQLFRSFISSSCATIADFSVLLLLVELASMSELKAGSISMFAGLIVSYLGGRFWVFPAIPHGFRRIEFFTFWIIAAVGMSLHIFMLHLCLRIGWHYVYAKGAAAVSVFCWNFIARRSTGILIHKIHAKTNQQAPRNEAQ